MVKKKYPKFSLTANELQEFMKYRGKDGIDIIRNRVKNINGLLESICSSTNGKSYEVKHFILLIYTE